MTQKEWDGLCTLMEDGFKGDFTDSMRSSYHTFLKGFSAEQIVGALKKLIEDGSPWLPKVPEIVKAIRDSSEPPVPAWGEVWTGLQRALNARSEEAAMTWMTERVHPVAAAFLSVEGWKTLKQVPFFDPDYGAIRVKELRERWSEFIEVAQERMRRGLALTQGTRRATGPLQLDAYTLAESLKPAPARRQLPAGGSS